MDTQATRTRAHSATHHDPLDVPDDDANDNPEPGAEPRERPAVALDAISDSAIDSLGKPSEGEGAKTKEDTAAQAQRVMAQQARKPRRGTSSRKDDGLKKGGGGKATVIISMGGRATAAWVGSRCRCRGGRAHVCREV